MKRRAVRISANVGESRHGLENAREAWLATVWARLSEAGDAQDCHARVNAVHPLARDTPPVKSPRTKILNKHIVVRQHAAQKFAALLLVQVQSDTALVAIGYLPPQRNTILVGGQSA